MIKKLLIRLILGQKKEYVSFMTIRGQIYRIDICPRVPFSELVEKAVNAGILTAQRDSKEEDF